MDLNAAGRNECLIQIQAANTEGVSGTLSCDFPERPGPFLHRVCREDLRHARLLAIGASLHEDTIEVARTIIPKLR